MSTLHEARRRDSGDTGAQSATQPNLQGRPAALHALDDAAAGPRGEAADGAAPEPNLHPTAHPLVRDLMLAPERWRIWPAIAVLRWMLAQSSMRGRNIRYRSKPSLDFSPGEVVDVAIERRCVSLMLSAPGFAAPGSPLPTADIARIIRDHHRGGALATWLDGPIDRFMQALEASQARTNAAFALATGGPIRALRNVSEVSGRSAPLWTSRTGELGDTWSNDPSGAVGLATFFMGNVTAVGLEDMMRSFTQLPVRVEEFTGADVAVLQPVRVGRPIGEAMIGARCWLAAGGVSVVIEGGSDVSALEWAYEASRRRTLHLLARTYIGSDSPQAHVRLEADSEVVPPVALGGKAGIGAGAVLGKAEGIVRLPIPNA